MNNIDFGKSLTKIRKAKGITQEELAEKCNISTRTIQRIEGGKVSPRAYTIKIISEVLEFDFFKPIHLEDSKVLIPTKSTLNTNTIIVYIKDLFNLKTNTMKKLSILTTLTLLIGIITINFNSKVIAQSKSNTITVSDIKSGTSNNILISKNRIRIVFTNDFDLNTLNYIKTNLNKKGISINYNNIQFNSENKLSSLDCSVNFNDGHKGKFSFNSKNKNNIGIDRNYSKKVKDPLILGKLKKLIVIDPAHGGIDFGANHHNIYEKDIVLSIARKIIEANNNPNIEYILTRDSDNFVSLKNRIKLINSLNPMLTISLHLNYDNNTNKKGCEMYIGNKFEQKPNKILTSIKKEINSITSVKNIKNSNNFILKHTKSPTTLIEIGFITNEIDRAFLNSKNGQKNIANAILKGTIL